MQNKIAIRKDIFAISFLVLFTLYTNYAGAATCDPSSGYFCNPLNIGNGGTDTLAGAIILVIQALLSIVGIFALFFLVVGGVKYIVAAGSEDSMASAKHTITSALTGLILALTAYSIVTALEQILKVKN